MERLTAEDRLMLWPDERWPQDIGALAIVDGARLLDPDGRGRGIQAIPDGTSLACWLPIKPGLTVHGLRHGHKTWMAEDGTPEILAEQCLGHQVTGMRGLYAHASDRNARRPQARTPDPIGRLPTRPRGHQSDSPVPLPDELLAAEATHRNQPRPETGRR